MADPRRGEIILARLTADGSFVVGRKVNRYPDVPTGAHTHQVLEEDVVETHLENVYRLKVSEPAPGKVSADFYNLMHPVSGHPANLSFNYILTSVPAPDWIADKYLELTSGLVVAKEVPGWPSAEEIKTKIGKQIPVKDFGDLVFKLGRSKTGEVN